MCMETQCLSGPTLFVLTHNVFLETHGVPGDAMCVWGQPLSTPNLCGTSHIKVQLHSSYCPVTAYRAVTAYRPEPFLRTRACPHRQKQRAPF